MGTLDVSGLAGTRPDLADLWDVAIVGSGIGGATIGRALATQGFSVLFIERGGAISATEDRSDPVTPADRLARGWWPLPVSEGPPGGPCRRFFAGIGCAQGGSSIHYAAALERMAASDFDALQARRQFIPRWPVTFDEFSAFYAQAEALYGLADAPPADALRRISDWDRQLMQAMIRNGLRPDLLRVAMRYDGQCKECIGTVCPRGCKADARSACLDVALREPRCRMLDLCEVVSLEADATTVQAIRARRLGEEVTLRARVVIVAAGALHTPKILLQSANVHWPEGLANRSGQVGRNLMFHTADILALWAPRRLDRTALQKKSLSIRDFYVRDGERLGYVQSMGLEAGRGEIAGFLKDYLRRHGIGNELLLRLLAKVPSIVASAALGGAGIFAAMTEDDPDPDNRLVLNGDEPDGMSFTYTITDDLRRRADALRDSFARHVRPWRLRRLSTELTMNYGHPCGTCRFGEDPATSVIDPRCRAHDVDNLYVVDASFMPRSGAVNPSLTIAANALRVAPHVAARLRA